MMKLTACMAAVSVLIVAFASGDAFARDTNKPQTQSVISDIINLLTGAAPVETQTTGQPNQSCEDLGNQPGNSISAPGSPFNPDGHAGTVYAGEQPQNSRNPHSVSQYDVACARPQH